MHVAVLGTGTVGQVLANKLLAQGHHVAMGSREAGNEKAAAWAEGKPNARTGTFAEAAHGADLVLLAVSGGGAEAAVRQAGDALNGRVVIDLTNPLDFSRGFPPSLFVSDTDSLAERLQRAAPLARFVKTLNTVANPVMVDPGQLGAETTLFVAGDDADAKAQVRALLASWGWTDIVDMGPLAASRGLEAWLLLWTRLYGALGTGLFNLKIVR